MMRVTEVKPRSPRKTGISGLAIILLATAISGVAAYVVTWLVPNVIGLADYATFAVFWSAIYLVVGALFGIQQEVTRGTRPATATTPTPASSAQAFAFGTSGLVFVVIVATAPLWVRAVFPTEGWSLVWPLAVGTTSYVLVAVLCGSLYGVSAWLPLALMMTVDAVLRLAAIGIVLVFTSSVVALAWAVALPFLGTLVALWLFVRGSVVGKSYLDMHYRALTWNVTRTILAAASSGLMVSGFPLILGLTSHSEPKALVGMFILTITLTRAPLIVIAMSLQSYFVVMFRDFQKSFWRLFLGLQGIILGSGVVLAAFGWVLGPPVFQFLFRGLSPDGWFIAVLVASSALVAALCISAPAALARSLHFAYTLGWFVASLITVVILLLPIDLTARTVLALLCGPTAGLLVHGSFLVGPALTRRPGDLTA